MKAYVFNQFSSNHSGGFELLGVFGSAAEAQKVANELKTLSRDIVKWKREECAKRKIDLRREDQWSEVQALRNEISSPEQTFLQKYNLSADPFDFIGPHRSGDYELTVEQAGRLVFLGDGHAETWHGPEPFDGFLQQMGATVLAINISSDRMVAYRVIVDLPNTERLISVKKWMFDPSNITVRACTFESLRMSFETGPQSFMSLELSGLFHAIRFLIEQDCSLIDVGEIAESDLPVCYRVAAEVSDEELVLELAELLEARGIKSWSFDNKSWSCDFDSNDLKSRGIHILDPLQLVLEQLHEHDCIVNEVKKLA